MSVAKHEGEYWLTVDAGRPERVTLWTEKPERNGNFWVGHNLPTTIRPTVTPGLRELADPEKPVRIRLKMEAEVIDG
jgi:hypothetical protein